MHIDLPTRSDIERLAAAQEPCCVSIYLPTSMMTVDSESNQLRARALFKGAVARVRERVDAESATAIEDQLNSLLEDTGFWFKLGRSLALFVTPDQLVEYRLPNQVTEQFAVSDRFSVLPILRAITFPQSALVLALSQHGLRLIEVSANSPAHEIPLPDAPHDAASAVGLDSIAGRSQFGRLQGDEGRKVRLTQYARAVDHALRPLLNGKSLPLILAATDPLESIYRNLSGYAHVAERTIRGNPEELSEAQLADAAREILDELYAEELSQLHETFADRQPHGRASSDLGDLARAATFGAIATLAVNMDAKAPGSILDDGTLALATSTDTTDHDVFEEIARRSILAGARVLAVREADMPQGVAAAGTLRYTV